MKGLWLEPFTGGVLQTFTMDSGPRTLTIPDFRADVALRLTGTEEVRQFSVTDVGYTQDGARIEWSVVLGRSYQVHSSPELQTWSPLGKILHPSAGSSSLFMTDRSSHGLAKRFYKVAILPRMWPWKSTKKGPFSGRSTSVSHDLHLCPTVPSYANCRAAIRRFWPLQDYAHFARSNCLIG